MGEFAHGIHVYTNNYKNLIHIVNKILIQNGFEPTDSDTKTDTWRTGNSCRS